MRVRASSSQRGFGGGAFEADFMDVRLSEEERGVEVENRQRCSVFPECGRLLSGRKGAVSFMISGSACT